MKRKTFLRGIHPADGKALSKDCPIRLLRPQNGEFIFPLGQHIGAPAVPLVSVGDSVLVGQEIAKPGGFVSAAIHSSVSGTVKAIEPRTTVMGETRESIVIENDGRYEICPGVGVRRGDIPSANAVRDIVKESGIIGLGGAGFPTHVKLTVKDDSKVEYVIVNAAECEPYLTSDYRMMIERPDELVAGLKILLSLFPNARGVIAIEDNKPDAVQLLTEKISTESRMEVCPLVTKYPQGGERMLIHAVTGRDICAGMLPYDAGCIVDNVATVIAVYRAVMFNEPLTTTIMTVTGDAVKTPGNFEVPVGCSHRALLEEAGGFSVQPEKVISGGPMMGTALFTLDIPVQKTSSSILAFAADPVAAHPAGPCIHCGRCVSACPERLIPQMLQDAADHDDFSRFEALGGMECIECGSCAVVCPAHRTLTQSFKYGKQSVNRIRRATAKK